MQLDKKTPLLMTLIDKRHVHARKCKEHLDECGSCRESIKFFASVPLGVLSEALQERQRPPLRTSMLDAGVANFMDLYTSESERNIRIPSKRKAVMQMGRAIKIFQAVADARKSDEQAARRKKGA